MLLLIKLLHCRDLNLLCTRNASITPRMFSSLQVRAFFMYYAITCDQEGGRAAILKLG